MTHNPPTDEELRQHPGHGPADELSEMDHAAIDESITLRQEVSGFGAIIRTQPFWVFLALIALAVVMTFVSDAFMNSCRFRVFAIVDDFSRECLGLVADTSLSGLRVARELPEVMRHRGRPKTIVSELPSIAT